MSKNVVRSTTINVPVERVFSFLSDPTNWMTAMPASPK
ncbi:SRPBCC family protein [Pseudarthrobacter sp. L1SW]|nr:SRPBCC family protein [Pseudarthrobacter sp. L1SW]UEL29514.1 SRPBCC family protein [Pseudarthrobacter sp. L1SW]